MSAAPAVASSDLQRCTKCGDAGVAQAINTGALSLCARCGHEAMHYVFPAYFNAQVKGQAAAARGAEEASCFFHPQKVAELACDGCGRFLCSVCDINMGDRHLCTECLQGGHHTEAESQLETQRTLHDSVTLAIALFSTFPLYFLAPFTSPYVLYRTVRYWNVESSITGRGKWRLVLGGLIGLVQFGLTLFLLVVLWEEW